MTAGQNPRLGRLWGDDGRRIAARGGPLLAASVICADPLRLGEEMRSLEEGGVDLLHCDIMDGHFVPRLGLTPEIVRAVRDTTSLPVDVHLMLSNPGECVPVFANAGADVIFVHAEMPHLPRLLDKIHAHGARAGVAFNPETPVDMLRYVLDDTDLVLLMMCSPGSVGGNARPAAVRKIGEVKDLLGAEASRIHLIVDGNVCLQNAVRMVELGATILVCGSSSVFLPGQNPRDSVLAFRRAIGERSSRVE